MRFRGVAWPPGERLRAIITKEVHIYIHTHTSTEKCVCQSTHYYNSRTCTTASRHFRPYVITCIGVSLSPSHIVFTNAHTPKHTEKHTPLLWSHHKQSFKHIFFQNTTSCSVQLWEVIITFIDVNSQYQQFEYSWAPLYFHPTSFRHVAKGIQMNFSLSVAQKPVLALRLLRLSKFPLVLSWQANTQHFML